MINWDVIDAIGDDETEQINNYILSSSLYEAVKLAYFEPSNYVEDIPHITSRTSYGLISIAINSSVFIFGEECARLLLKISLDNYIRVLVFLPGGKFLMIGDSSNTLHLLHIESKMIIFTKKLSISSSGGEFILVEGRCLVANNGLASIVFFTNSGEIMNLSNIDYEALEEGLNTKDIPFLNSLQMKIIFSSFTLSNLKGEVLCGDCIALQSKICVWIGTKYGFYGSILGGTSSVCDELIDGSACTQVISLMNGRYLAVLDSGFSLHLICGCTGCVLWHSDVDTRLRNNIKSMQLQSFDVSSSQLILFLLEWEDKGSGFCLLKVPSFDCTFMVFVNFNSILLKLVGSGADSLPYLDPEFETKDETEFLSRFKLKIIVDGIPEARLSSLLRKYKFKEAEDFCHTFNLDLNEVFKSKARYICESMNPWQVPSSNSTLMADHQSDLSEHLDELMTTLKLISDDEFVTSLCTNVPLVDVDSIVKLHYFAKDRLAAALTKGESDHLSGLLMKVSKNLNLLCTFQSIFATSDVQDWLVFSRSDILQLFLKYLRKSSLDIAATIWHQHQFDFLHRVNESCVLEILEAIPPDVPSSKLCSWLPDHIIKDLIQFCKSSIEIIAEWTVKKIKNLEIMEKEGWPTNGYAMAKAVIECIDNICANSFSDDTTWQAYSPFSHFSNLRQVAMALSDMQVLLSKFFVKIKFSDYTQVDKGAVCGTLLDWLVSGQAVEPLITGFLRSFTVRHSLNLDEVLANYVSDSLASFSCSWRINEEALWEDKLYAVIRIISNSTLKAESILKCIQIATIPWSKGTEEMSALGVSLNTSLSEEFVAQKRYSQLKLILRRYNLHSINYEDRSKSYFILRSILNREGDNIINDALTVASAFPDIPVNTVYFYRLVYLLSTGNFHDAKLVLTNITADVERNMTCERLMMYVSQQLNAPVLLPQQQKLQNLTSGMLALEPLCNMETKFSMYDDFFSKIKNINAIQKFGLYPSIKDLENRQICLAYVENYIIELYVNFHKPKPKSNHGSTLNATDASNAHLCSTVITCSNRSTLPTNTSDTICRVAEENFFHKNIRNIENLAYYFDISHDVLYSMLSSLAIRRQDFSIALLCAEKLSAEECMEIPMSTILKMAGMMSDFLKHDLSSDVRPTISLEMKKRFVDVVLDLISRAILICDPCEFEVFSFLAFWFQIMKLLYLQCHNKLSSKDNDFSISLSEMKKKIFLGIFCESSMPVEESVVTSLVTTIVERVIYFVQEELENITKGLQTFSSLYYDEIFSKSLIALCNHLQDRNQDVLAMIIAQYSFSSHNLAEVESLPRQTYGIGKSDIQVFVMKIVNSLQRDVLFSCSLLSLLSVRESLNVMNDMIKKVGHDYKRLALIGEVGLNFCKLNGLNKASVSGQFSSLITRALWGEKLEKFSISFKMGLLGDYSALKSIFEDLALSPHCNLTLLYNFCNDHQLDHKEALEIYLRSLIRRQDRIYHEILAKRDNQVFEIAPDFSQKLSSVIRNLGGISEHVHSLLEKEFQSVCSYNYELLEVVLGFMCQFMVEDDGVSAQRKDVLHFLKTYKRNSLLREYEAEICPQCDRIGGYPASTYLRLPFHELAWKSKIRTSFIKDECNGSNTYKWVSAASIFSTNKDQLYLLAASNMIEHLKKQVSCSHSYSDYQITNIDGVDKIYEILGKVNNCTYSAALANTLFDTLPPGFDKVETAKLIISLAKSSLDVSPSDQRIKGLFKKFSYKYDSLAAEYALYKYGLNEPNCLSMCKKPHDLIFFLYEHPSISSASMNSTDIKNINACISDICQVVGVEKTNMELSLLAKWLPESSMSSSDYEQTVTNFKLDINQETFSEIPENNLFDSSFCKLICLLRCLPREMATSYLCSQIRNDVNSEVRLKALRCLLAVADEETVKSKILLSMVEVRDLLQTLTFVAQLEKFGYAISQSSFEAMDKDTLIEGIWRTHKTDPDALLLMIDLCRTFKISKVSRWDSLFGQLLSLCHLNKVTVNVLEKMLMETRNSPTLWLLPRIIASWEYVIFYPFQRASHPLTKEDMKNCCRAVNVLMQSCPVDVALGSLFDMCENLRLPILSLAICTKTSSKDKIIQSVMNKNPKKWLKSQYEEVKEQLVFPLFIQELISSLD